MLDRNKPVQTRDGRKVTIYAWDVGASNAIHGCIFDSCVSWREDGRYFGSSESELDLINTPQTTVRRLKATPENGFMICDASDEANLILQFEDGKLTRAEVV
jgi:hypothetical protein